MAGNSIGSGVVTLSANADGLVAGLAKSSTDFDRWGTIVTSQAHKIAANTNLAICKIGMKGPPGEEN